MVRTKADGGGGGSATRKAVAARAPRKALGSAASSSSADGSSPASSKYAGGNPVCVRPTPDWQRDITKFFKTGPGDKKEKVDKENSAPVDDDITEIVDESIAGGSGSASKS
ncbi:hypothetical protein LOTGIDRAFT_235857 [Lottia gigantea]|uniref:PCNA-associated factor n=1 Tax=Lottia gigantea TaxID=225164 RepID=V3ZLL7_LOTGI|nr:hypothetical protein LOTGIDRAFT_235857 [Lottia gigantea]ESO85192.1 hypothetical protein LOTGIDRAFT_235857 [Lottia gigantea]